MLGYLDAGSGSIIASAAAAGFAGGAGGARGGRRGPDRRVTNAAGDVRSEEPASFRDPATTVFYDGDRVLRGLDDGAAADWRALAGAAFFPRLVGEGKVVRTDEADSAALGPLAERFAAVLEHERVPFVSYPHEWPFGMLRDAA